MKTGKKIALLLLMVLNFGSLSGQSSKNSRKEYVAVDNHTYKRGDAISFGTPSRGKTYGTILIKDIVTVRDYIDTMNGTEVGKKLKQARLNKNLSQDFMAEMLDVSQKTYSNFENNKTTPNFSQIEEISKILDISILDFLEDTEKYNFYQNNTGTNNGFVVNNFSEKLIEQYELRIKKLEEENVYLKSLLDRMLK